MVRRAFSAVVALTVLLAALSWPGAGVGAATGARHACCRRVQAPATGCRTQAISCCPSPQHGGDSTLPPAASTGGTVTMQQIHIDVTLPGVALIAARTVRAHARSSAALKAPPDPLYLKHLTLLV